MPPPSRRLGRNETVPLTICPPVGRSAHPVGVPRSKKGMVETRGRLGVGMVRHGSFIVNERDGRDLAGPETGTNMLEPAGTDEVSAPPSGARLHPP
jgi:hypothetical protein